MNYFASRTTKKRGLQICWAGFDVSNDVMTKFPDKIRTGGIFHGLVLINSKMEAVSSFVRVQLPNYLKALPIPNSLDGIGKLSGNPLQCPPFY